MGAIRGDLSVLSIANLVQALVLDRSEGLLTLISGLEQRVIRVSAAGIRLVRGSPRCHRLERLLRRVYRISLDPAETLKRTDNATGREAAGRLVREWMLEEICELFTWSRGTFEFQRVERSEKLEEGPFAVFGADCDVTRVALEAARWADQLPRIKTVIRDLRLVPERTEAPIRRDAELDAEALADVLPLVNGRRSIMQILQTTVFSRFVILQVLYRLVLQGALRLRTPGEAARVEPSLQSVA